MIDKILSENDIRELFREHCFYTCQTRDAVTEDCLCDLFGFEIADYIRNLRFEKNGLRKYNHSAISDYDDLRENPSKFVIPDPFNLWRGFEAGKRCSVLIYDYTCFTIAASLRNKQLVWEKYINGDVMR